MMSSSIRLRFPWKILLYKKCISFIIENKRIPNFLIIDCNIIKFLINASICSSILRGYSKRSTSCSRLPTLFVHCVHSLSLHTSLLLFRVKYSEIFEKIEKMCAYCPSVQRDFIILKTNYPTSVMSYTFFCFF